MLYSGRRTSPYIIIVQTTFSGPMETLSSYRIILKIDFCLSR